MASTIVRESQSSQPLSEQRQQAVRQFRMAIKGGLAGTPGRYAVRLLSILAGLLLWRYLTVHKTQFILRFANVPTPMDVWTQLSTLIRSSDFYTNIAVSVRRVGISFGLATMLGVPLGIAMGRFRFVKDIVEPYIEIVRPIPAVAWIPMAIIIWPTSEESILFITFLGAFFPIVVNTVHGVDQTPEILVRAARTLGARTRSVVWHVVLPAALPSILSGLSIGMGVSWFSVLTAEMIGGQYGIGYFTWESYELIRYPDIIIGMVVIGLLGTISTAMIRWLARPFLRWLPRKAS